MYAFLSRVFGRKKDDKDASSSSQPVLGPGELLGGRFEAVSPNVSPAAQFLEFDTKTNDPKDKDKDKDVGFSFFKGKWRPASPDVKPTRKLDVLPHLSLNFQEPRAVSAAPDLGLLFTTDQILSDAVIGKRRLNPLEALVLVQACSQAIIAKGLETLGIMHPHWYAASQGIQRRVISHFIYLLDLEKLTSIPSPASPTSPISSFEAEVNDTLAPHDIAAILRWGLRHVQIDGDSFGTDDEWYNTFLEAEGAAGYPQKAFSDKLAPLIPTAHLQLLTATLETFSSLAAHAEVNGTSGSKLCKIFGLWLLTAHRVEDKGDWQAFYARWECTGRMLEHLFLSRIRDESSDQRMPVRLLELVRKYPYTKGISSPTTDLPLLSRPPFTTRLHDAFFVRIEIELPYGRLKPASKLHPLLLLTGALSTKVEEGEYADLWTKITTASKDGDSSTLSNIFTDDTIRFLSLVPDEPIGHEVRSPTFSLVSPVSPHKRSFSADDADKSEAIVAEHPKSATEPSAVLSPLSPLSNGIGSDWAQFSTSGFLETSPNIIPLASTLLDTDIEKTIPPEPVAPLSRKSSRRSKAASPSSPRKSVDMSRPETEIFPETKLEDIEEQKNIIKASQLKIIQLDEAFVDFWSDSLLDPISADWPTFIICKFKSSLVPELTFGVVEEGQKQKTIQWLVLEQAYTIRAPPVPSIPVETVRPRPSSPSSQSMSAKKRFSFWSVSRTASSSSATSLKGKKKEQELRVGEMGELLEEEPKNETKGLALVKVKSPIFRSRKSLDITRKSVEPTKKSIIKPADEAKIDEEATTAVAAVAAATVVASIAPVIAKELSTDGPHLVDAAVAVRTEVEHHTDAPAIEAQSTPTVQSNNIPPFTAVVSSLEAKVETERENFVPEGTAITAKVEATEVHPEPEPQPKLAEMEPVLLAAEGAIGAIDSKDRSSSVPSVVEAEVVVENVVETEGRVETDPIAATQAATVFIESEVDAPPMTTEAPVTSEDTESMSVSPQHGVIVAPLVSEIAISSEPEIVDTEAPLKPDSTSTTEESPAIFTSEPETSQVIEVAPIAVDRSLLAESEGTDVENEVSLPETVELQPGPEPKALGTEHVFSSVEETTTDVEETADIAINKTSDAAAQLPHEVAAQEVSQPQSDAILVDQVENITASTNVERFDTAEDIEAKDTVFKEETLHEVTNLEPEVKTEASAEPVPASIEQTFDTNIEREPEATHSDEQVVIAGSSPKVERNGNAKLQSEPEQETVTAQEDVSTSKGASIAVVSHEVEAEFTAETHGMDAPIGVANVAAESTEAEPVMPVTEGDSTEHENEAFTEAVRLATPEDFSSMDKPEPEVTHEAMLEAANNSLENGTTLKTEPQYEVDAPAAVVEDTILDTQTSLPNDPTPLEPENGPIETEVGTENQIEAASVPAVEDVPVDMDDHLDNPSLTEIAPNAQQDIEVESRVIDDSPNTKDEPISNSDIAEAKTDGVRLEPEVDPVTPVEEEPSIIARAEEENLSPGIEGEVTPGPDETSPTLETETASMVNIETQIVTPVDEHAAPVETSRTDELVEVVLPPSVEESPETLEPIVEPSHESPDDEMIESHVVPEVDAVVPEAQVLGEGELVPATEEPAASVELNLEQGTAANTSQEPVTPEPEQPVTHEETPHISSNSPEALLIPEVNASIAVETESEPLSTDPAPEDKISTLDVEEHVMLSSETSDAANMESKDEIIPLATAEPEPEVLTSVSETLEVAQDSVEETTEESDAVVEAPSEKTLVPETAPAISEPIIAVPEDLQTENGSITHEGGDLVDVPPTDGEKPVAPLAEFNATAIPSTAEPPAAEIASVVSELATAVPEGLQIENGGIAQAEENAVGPPPTDNPVQEEPIAPLTESNEAVEIPPTSMGESASVISEPATEAPEDVQIENDSVVQAEENADDPPPTDDPVQEAVTPVVGIEESVEIFSTAEPPVTEIAPVIAEPATVVPEDLQIENGDVPQVEEDLVPRPPPTNDPVQEEAAVPLAEFKEEVEIPSTDEIPAVVSEPATGVPEDLQIENDSVPPAEAVLIESPPDIEEIVAPTEEFNEAVEIPSTADIAPVVSEPATVVPEDPQIENDSAAQAVDLVDPPPIDDPVQEPIAPLAEFKEAVEVPTIVEIPPVVSEQATVVPEDIRIENDSVAQAEADLIDPPPIEDTIQENVPSTAEVPPVVSELATVVPEDLQIENDSVAQTEADLADPPPPTDDPIQEKTVAPLAESKEVVEVPSAAEIPPVVSEPTTVVPEDSRIENDSDAQVADLVDPPPIDDSVQEEPVAPLAEFEEAVEIPSTAEIPPVVSEQATVVPEDLHIQNGSVAQAEANLIDSPPPTDNSVQEKDVTPLSEFKEAFEVPSTAEIPPVVSEPATVVPEDTQIENDSVAQAETHLIDPAPPIDDPVQEETAIPLAAFKEAAEVLPSTAEIPPVVSELAVVVPEDLHTENGSVAQAEANLVDPPPIEDPVQESVAPLAEFKVVESPPSVETLSAVISEPVPNEPQIENSGLTQAENDLADLPLTTNSPIQESAVAEPAAAVPEDLPIENDNLAQAEEDSVDPPAPIDDPIREVVTPIVELKAAAAFSTAEPLVSETLSDIVSEQVVEDLQIENGSITVDNTVQEEPLAEVNEAVEIPSTTEPTVAEVASVVSELSTMVPKDLPIDSGCIPQEDNFPPEDMGVSQSALSEVEAQSFEEAGIEIPETHVLNDNEYSATEQETNGTLDDSLEATSDNVTTEDAKAEPMVTEPIHHLNISPVTLEPPSTTD